MVDANDRVRPAEQSRIRKETVATQKTTRVAARERASEQPRCRKQMTARDARRDGADRSAHFLPFAACCPMAFFGRGAKFF